MVDPENTMATIARSVEQLHANLSSPHEKDLITARLLGLAREKKEARTLIGSHSQAMPLFISILRNGTTVAKVNVAATISVLCKEEDLRLKVLLGGCIPSLLSLLKSKAIDSRKAAAEALYEVSSGSLSEDHVGVKIFVTEGVVPALWEQLNPKINQDKVVEGFVTGALRNLCGDKDGYWRATLDAGGVDIIIGFLSSDNVIVQSNAASLLARLISAFSDSIPKVIRAGAVEVLLQLVDRDNDVLVRASAADALQSLCSKSSEAKESIVNANGIPILIGAVVAPSKEGMQGESGGALQSCAMHALANICGGISEFIMYLGELSQAPRLLAPVADIIGSLAYSLMVYKLSDGEEDLFNVKRIEDILVMLLKPRDNKHIQDSVLEALASLYGNPQLSRYVHHAEAKKVLIGLITMAIKDVQEQLISSFVSLCCNGVGIWEALEKREGVQLLISFLGLSGEQHQEYAVSLLAILTEQVDDSKWAITAAGGIPPLVQLLEIGSQQAREDAAHVLWNLCCHSEDIRACVESADAVSALLWLLKSGGSRGQRASAKALLKLIRSPDAATVNQLLALLLGDAPISKIYIISVLGHVLSLAAHNDLLKKGAPANKGLRSLVEILNSSNEETQEHAASVLADLFISRPDICDSLATDEIIHPCIKLLTSKTQGIATQSARALGALSRPSKAKSTNKMPQIAEDDVKPLIELAKTSSIGAAETAVAALANLLSDPKIAGQALAEDIVSALTRVLEEGTLDGKANASRALHQLLIHFPVGEVLSESDQSQFLVNALVDALNAMNLEGADSFEGLEVLALLSRTKQNINFKYPSHIAFFGGPSTITTLVKCLAEGGPQVQEKAVEILSHLCGEHLVLLSDLLVDKPQCIASLTDRIMRSSSLEVRVGGTDLLICVMKEHKQRTVDSLDSSGLLKHLILSLVEMVGNHTNSTQLGNGAMRTVHVYKERTPYYHEGDNFEVPDPGIGLSATSALWLLSLISSALKEDRITVMEAGALEVLSEKFAKYAPNSLVSHYFFFV